MKASKLQYILAYLGLLPFILCTLAILLEYNTLPILGESQQVFSVYALIILAFMAGSHWGQQLNSPAHWKIQLQLFSNVIAIIVWLCFLTLPFRGLLALYSVAYVLLWLMDARLYRHQLIQRQYFITRTVVTACVLLLFAVNAGWLEW